MKTLLVICVLLLEKNIWAQPTGKIECELSPKLYVGNVQFNLDPKNGTFEITYDNPKNLNDKVVSVRGQAFFTRKDSMGFDEFYLCTSQTCSVGTLLGQLKSVDQARGGDKTSYFKVSPNSKVKIEAIRFGRKFYLTGINELHCNY